MAEEVKIPLLRQWAFDKFGKEKVNSRLQQIIEGTKLENAESLKIKMAVDTTLLRLKKLIELDLNIEYMTLGGQLLEYRIKRIISAYEFTINSSLILQDFNSDLKTHIAYENTLGQLLKQLKTYCDNEKLQSRLGDFNGKRIAATHRVYDKFQDINKVNEELKGFVKKDPVQTLLKELDEVQASLVNEMIAKLNEYGLVPVPGSRA